MEIVEFRSRSSNEAVGECLEPAEGFLHGDDVWSHRHDEIVDNMNNDLLALVGYRPSSTREVRHPI